MGFVVHVFSRYAALTLYLGGSVYPWVSAHVLATLIIGVILLVGLGFWCAYASPSNPFLPIHLFGDIRFMAVVCIETTGAMSYYAFAISEFSHPSSLY